MSEFVISARRGAEYDVLRVITGFIVIGILVGFGGMALAVTFGGESISGKASWAALGQAVLLAGAAMSCGAMTGFLFAVPRARSLPQSSGSATADLQSNLEQIADWLTKGLVGAAIVSIPRMPELVDQLGAFTAVGLYTEWGKRVSQLILLYFGLMGLFAGYVIARMQFITLFDRAPFIVSAIETLQRVPVSPNAEHRITLTLDQLAAVESFARLPVSQLHGRYERWQWAKSQMVIRGGDVAAAMRVYDDLARTEADPQLMIERSIAQIRLNAVPPPPEPTAEAAVAPAASALEPVSAQATANEMFLALYQSAPDGFEAAIRIGEDLVTRVRDSSIWAYLACAYGQKYKYETEQRGTQSSELGPVRERALFSVKQALDLNADKWRSTLRGLWDRNAVRSGGDDDLVVFSGDPEFAALLDVDSSAANANATAVAAAAIVVAAVGATSTSAAPRPIRYMGSAQLWLTDEVGKPLTGETPTLRTDAAYRLFVRLIPDGTTPADVPGASIQELRVVEGDDRPRVEFEFRPDGVEFRFSPERSVVTATLTEATAECSFDFRAPSLRGEDRELYVEIAQGRRIIRTIPLKVRIAPAND